MKLPPIRGNGLLWLCIAAAAINIGMSLAGYPVIGHDAYVHLNWLDQYSRLFAAGQWYPRWLPESFGGFGSPTFFYYPPLVYWFGSLLWMATKMSPTALYNTIQLLATIASCWTGYLYLRTLTTDTKRAVIASLIYGFSAYRFLDVFVRSALTEHVGFVFLPLVFLGVGRVCGVDGRRKFGYLFLVVGTAGLLLTNLPMAILAGLSGAIYLVFVARSVRAYLVAGLAAIHGVLIAAVYLAPLPDFADYIHSEHLTTLQYPMNEHRFALLNLVHGQFDLLTLLSCSVFIVSVALLLMRFGVGNQRPSPFLLGEGRGGKAWGVIGIAAVVLQIPILTNMLWTNLLPLQYLQFSWRWNAILTLFIAVAALRSSRRSDCILWALMLITIITSLISARNIFRSDIPPALDSYRMDAPEYAPRWASANVKEVLRVTHTESRKDYVQLDTKHPGDTLVVHREGGSYTICSHLADSSRIRLCIFYYPMWDLRSSGLELIPSADSNGFLQATFPAGDHSFRLEMGNLKSQYYEEKISLWALLGLAGMAVVTLFRGGRRPRRPISG